MPDINQEQQQANALRIQHAFGDDVALDFLRLRGIEGERARDQLIERYELRQSGTSLSPTAKGKVGHCYK